MAKILAIVVVASITIQGGYFPNLYLILGLVLSILLLFRKEIKVHFPLCLLYLSVVILYMISAILHDFSLLEYAPVFQVMIYPIFYLLLSSIENEEKRYLYLGIIISGIVVAYLGIFAYVGVIQLNGLVSNKRLQGVLQYANATAIILSAAILTLKLFENKINEKINSKLEEKLKWTKPAMIIALQLTMSFGGIICYWIGILIYSLLQSKQNKIKTLATEILEFSIFGIITASIFISVNVVKNGALSFVFAMTACAIGVICNNIKFKFTINKFLCSLSCVLGMVEIIAILLFRGKEALETFSERMVHSIDGAKAVLSNPILGIGPGRWSSEKIMWQSYDYRAQIIHNSYVQIAVDAGIIAIIVIFIIIGIWLKISIKRDWKTASTMCLLLHGIIDLSFYFTGIGLAIIIMMDTETKKEVKLLTLPKAAIRAMALISAGLFLLYNIAYRLS